MVQKYESLFIIDGELSEEEIKAMVEKIQALVSENGELESIDEWGKRRLSYPINYKTDGYYVLVTFNSETSFPKELERIFKITEGILKYLIINKEK